MEVGEVAVAVEASVNEGIGGVSGGDEGLSCGFTELGEASVVGGGFVGGEDVVASDRGGGGSGGVEDVSEDGAVEHESAQELGTGQGAGDEGVASLDVAATLEALGDGGGAAVGIFFDEVTDHAVVLGGSERRELAGGEKLPLGLSLDFHCDLRSCCRSEAVWQDECSAGL